MENILEHKTEKKLSPGSPDILGATPQKDGVNFSIFSKYARQVFLLLFSDAAKEPTDVIKIENKTNDVWHVFVHGAAPGQLYGYKVNGNYSPKEGLRFNPHKLLIDPYAKALTGKFKSFGNMLFSYDLTSPDKDLAMDPHDNDVHVPKCIVISDDFEWQGDYPPNIPLEKLIIYEAHLKGFTAHSESSKVKNPGTYLGFTEKIPYLKELGINAVELLPVHEFHVQDYLLKKGLTNFWGYDSIGFFAPESSYGSGGAASVNEFKSMVRQLHKAGIEVILDVVYNHTAEGNELGPTLSFKGIDNSSYYSLMQNTPEEPFRFYKNDTGCGNTINIENPAVMRLVLDSLRYWAQVMHIDGFRFDLASILARVKGQFSDQSTFFQAISKDPVLSKVKMIAEPWDLTTYQAGSFPRGWSEWNDRFRNAARKYLKDDDGMAGEIARRITGSADIFQADGKRPGNSINFVTCHDGFTLLDLFSYNTKHNEANLEENKDGSNDNNSWNCGAEGETDDPKIKHLRKKMIKNALCLLLFSSGTPMILYGDELMRTQKGNNNAWCQDNELTRINWGFNSDNRDILEFCKKAIALRKAFPVLERKRFLTGKDLDGDHIPDIEWFDRRLKHPDWEQAKLKIICVQLDADNEKYSRLFFIFNPHYLGSLVYLPHPEGRKWYRILNTALKNRQCFADPGKERLIKGQQKKYYCAPRSIVLLAEKK